MSSHRTSEWKKSYEMHNTVLLKISKEKDLVGDNKCRLESVGTMWNCSQKEEPATRDDQKKYNIQCIEKNT